MLRQSQYGGEGVRGAGSGGLIYTDSTLGKFVNADERGIAEKREEYLRARMGEFRTELKGSGWTKRSL